MNSVSVVQSIYDTLRRLIGPGYILAATMYTPSKAAQIAAVFAHRHGDTINLLKLMKLMYLADRENIARYGTPITYDYIVSMPQGPVLSQIYNLTTGSVGGSAGAKWAEWITDIDNFDVRVKRRFSRDDLDELSDSDLESIEEVWSKFGHMDQWELVDYTHKYCTEWENPEGSSIPIKDKDVLTAVGYTPKEAKQLGEEIEAQRRLDWALASN